MLVLYLHLRHSQAASNPHYLPPLILLSDTVVLATHVALAHISSHFSRYCRASSRLPSCASLLTNRIAVGMYSWMKSVLSAICFGLFRAVFGGSSRRP